jgi:DNA-binding transcriptional ArsR family regulator
MGTSAQQFDIRDSRRPGHFWADNEIVDQHLPEIGVYGFAVYMLLCRYADSDTGQCFPSVGAMAAKLKISQPTVRAALEKLKEVKLITIRHRRKEHDGKVVNLTSIYTILAVKKGQKEEGTKPGLVPSEIEEGVLNEADQGTQSGLVGTKGDLGGVLNQVSSNKTHENKNHESPPPSPSAKRTPDKAVVMMLYSKGFTSSPAITAVAKLGIDCETLEQSIENLRADGWKDNGRIMRRLQDTPPEPGQPYPRLKQAHGPPTAPVIPEDVLTPAQAAAIARARRMTQ